MLWHYQDAVVYKHLCCRLTPLLDQSFAWLWVRQVLPPTHSMYIDCEVLLVIVPCMPQILVHGSR